MIQENPLEVVDLRSDTVTQPTTAMRAAMLAAPLGDDVFGDDPSVNALQERIAALLGFEAALFVPTGTQSNLCAVLAHCQRGDEYLVGQMAHCYRWEGGGAAVMGSVQPQPLAHQADGTLALADIESAIKPDDAHFARTRLVALENTLGGKLLPFDYVQAATALAARHGLARHLDGARLFNAAVAQAAKSPAFNTAATEARRIAHLLRQCVGLPEQGPGGTGRFGVVWLARTSSPVLIRIRKMAGGGMRQSRSCWPPPAVTCTRPPGGAPGATTTRLARRLAGGLAGVAGPAGRCTPQTNIVFVDLTWAARDVQSTTLLTHFLQGTAASCASGLYRLRFVTHLDVDAAGVDRAMAMRCAAILPGPERMPGIPPAMAGIDQLGLFIVTGLLLNLTPGPDVLYIVSQAPAGSGARAGRGGRAGHHGRLFCAYGFAAALGVSALVAASATAFTVLKWVGAAYLVYVGVAIAAAPPSRSCRRLLY
jgi:threonine aldolase